MAGSVHVLRLRHKSCTNAAIGDDMNMRYTSLSLALLGGLGVLAPSAAQAGIIGIYDSCAPSSDYASAAIALGHTTTPVATLDAPSLAHLDGLIVQLCAASPAPNAALSDAWLLSTSRCV